MFYVFLNVENRSLSDSHNNMHLRVLHDVVRNEVPHKVLKYANAFYDDGTTECVLMVGVDTDDAVVRLHKLQEAYGSDYTLVIDGWGDGAEVGALSVDCATDVLDVKHFAVPARLNKYSRQPEGACFFDGCYYWQLDVGDSDSISLGYQLGYLQYVTEPRREAESID